jgi:hypothetical protein
MSRIDSEQFAMLWNHICNSISNDAVNSSLQIIFRDIAEKLTKIEIEKKHTCKDCLWYTGKSTLYALKQSRSDPLNTILILMHYVAAYPAPYSAIAETLQVSRQYVHKVLLRESESMPWLSELIAKQSELYYKGSMIKELKK